MGGIVIWGSVLITLISLYVAGLVLPTTFFKDLDFLSRSQTLIPALSLLAGATIGFLNDFYDVTHEGKGLRLRVRLALIFILSGTLGWWFYDKLDVTTVNVPFNGAIELGILIIPFYTTHHSVVC